MVYYVILSDFVQSSIFVNNAANVCFNRGFPTSTNMRVTNIRGEKKHNYSYVKLAEVKMKEFVIIVPAPVS